MRPIFGQLTENLVTSLIAKKSRIITWIVSNCKTHSRREKLVNNLKKYFKIDVYGKCGNKTLPQIIGKEWIFLQI